MNLDPMNPMNPMNNRKITLLDYFPNFRTTDSLFSKMVASGAPWTMEIGQQMDIAYFTMHSGLKSTSTFVRSNVVNDVVDSTALASILYSMYGQVWNRLWEAYVKEYNPINNYNLEETIESEKTNDRTIGRTVKDTGTSEITTDSSGTITDNGTSELEHGHVVNTTSDNLHSVFGFNSTDAVSAKKDEQTGSQTNSGTDTTTNQNKQVSSSNSTVNSSSENNTKDDTEDKLTGSENITRSKSGNVGQNSYQDLLRQEFELWKWNFFNRVFDDCDKYLVQSVFNQCIPFK